MNNILASVTLEQPRAGNPTGNTKWCRSETNWFDLISFAKLSVWANFRNSVTAPNQLKFPSQRHLASYI